MCTNSIVILGNGFDVALGIPTRYSQFYNDSKELQYYANNGNALCNHILNVKGSLWSDLECGLYQYSLGITRKYGVGNVFQAQKLEREFNELRTALFDYLDSVASIPVNVDNEAPVLGLNIEWNELNPQFITFNYSINTANIADMNSGRIYNADDSINESSFIYQHGSIFDPKKGRNYLPIEIVLGLDYSTQQVEPLHSFLYKKNQNLHDLEESLSIIAKKSFYVVYGCSVGDSDAIYFKTVFNKNQRGKIYLIYGFEDKAINDIKANIERICGIDISEFCANNYVLFLDVTDVPNTRQKTKQIIHCYLNGLDE